MGTVADKLTYLNDTKTAIKDAIVAKGVTVADTDTFRSYADKIGQISGGSEPSTDEWQPNPKWWDIKKILDEDTRDYKGKVGVILYNLNDVSDFTLAASGMTAVATSDGAFYSYADNGSKVSHNWDTAQDKDDGRGHKTRWVIYYYTTDTTRDTFSNSNSNFGWAYNHIAYLVLRINCSNGSYFCYHQRLLEAIDNIGYSINGTFFNSFCYNCNSLVKLPDVLDTSNATDFGSFCYGCYCLTELPDGLDTSKGTSFSNFCQTCYSLQKLPDVLDTSKGTNFYSFCYNCYSLVKLPDVLDTSNGTTFGNFCSGCYCLTKLPDVLDTSNGTNFSSFCSYCYCLTKLPDVLDTSNGTNFSSFCSYCSSLQTIPDMTLSANTTAITSKYSGALFNASTWLVELPLTLPSNTNFWLDSSTRISIESFRYIADHAPDVTATPRTLTVGSTNISRINAEDPTIITDLNAKGWNVQ